MCLALFPFSPLTLSLLSWNDVLEFLCLTFVCVVSSVGGDTIYSPAYKKSSYCLNELFNWHLFIDFVDRTVVELN